MAKSSSQSQSHELAQLMQMFPALSKGVVSDVLQGVKGDQDQAVEKLLQFTQDGTLERSIVRGKGVWAGGRSAMVWVGG